MLILITTVGIFSFTDCQQFLGFKIELGAACVDTFFAVARDFAD